MDLTPPTSAKRQRVEEEQDSPERHNTEKEQDSPKRQRIESGDAGKKTRSTVSLAVRCLINFTRVFE